MYAKLFASLYQGTLRGCSDEILVFTNLLAHADISGIVDKHWKAIAEETGLSRERVEAAILRLEAPDTESRSPENEGRRIIRMDEHRAWGWQIVNHGKYRAIRSEDDRREQNRLAQERWRNKNNKQSKPPSAEGNTDKPIQKQKQKQIQKQVDQKPAVVSLPDWLSSEVWDSFKQHRGKKFTELAQKLMLKKLQELKEQGHDPNKAIENSIANGWSSVYPEKQKGQQNGSGYISERDKARKRVAKELCGYDPDAINGVSQRID
jgi:hypothetical protein